MTLSGNKAENETKVEVNESLSLDDFAYDLPEGLIAQEPAPERSKSRLMVLERRSETISHRVFDSIRDVMESGDVLVLNNTKVIPARILARRQSGGAVEILLIKPEANRPGVWQAMASPLRKLKEGDELFVEQGGGAFVLKVAGFTQSTDSQRRVLIDFGGQSELFQILSKIGHAPLPPYILRERAVNSSEFNLDTDRYQTVFALTPGAVAAPTAGLHFTSELLEELKARGVHVCFITLHVGPGTFKPISSSVEDHSIESEEFFISQEVADVVNRAREQGKRIFAVGTTSCRALETAGASGVLKPASGESSTLYIRPGYEFRIVNCLITNFHLSKSSLLVLVSAFAGHKFIRAAYQQAIEERYRFYSYGDAMLIL